MKASINGHIAVVKLLLESNANTNLTDDVKCLFFFGLYFLFACSSGVLLAKFDARPSFIVELCEILLICPVLFLPCFCRGFTFASKRRYTALIYASENGHSTIVRLLLKAGADKNAKNYVSSIQCCYLPIEHKILRSYLISRKGCINMFGAPRTCSITKYASSHDVSLSSHLHFTFLPFLL